ncbi:unnamed protein product [Meganyctiphanes norvegica]|uniref:Uncharacterized protein n=1 Tax=Meganyctiphanes norvegica TaxID=48144 RepID=A0AAV2S2L8_MEGNR
MSFAQSNLSIAEKSAIKFQDPHDFEWQCDKDSESRKCHVWLWTRPIGGREDEARTHRHWAMIFEWEDRTATYEAINTHGYIHPKWFDGKPKESDERWQQRTIEDIGMYMFSPHEVNEAAKNNRVNCCQFSYGHVNCQHWVAVLGEDLKIKVPEILAIAEPWTAVVASVNGFIKRNKTGILVGTGVLALGVLAGAGITTAVNKSKEKKRRLPV